jgi:cell wall-associated NlpC family hydrolase
MPESLGVDASGGVDLGSNSNLGMDAPTESNGLEQASYSDFGSMADSFKPYGFTDMMKDITTNAYATQPTTATDDDGTEYPTGAATGSASSLVKYAEQFLGTPYVWGGTSPNGFDCSGFVQYVMKKFGKSLPRISADQARSGKQIGLNQLKPGDLVAWDNSSRNNGADHIGIYIGNGQYIAAPKPGDHVKISSLKGNTKGAWGVSMGF